MAGSSCTRPKAVNLAGGGNTERVNAMTLCERCAPTNGFLLVGLAPDYRALRCKHEDAAERRTWQDAYDGREEVEQ